MRRHDAAASEFFETVQARQISEASANHQAGVAPYPLSVISRWRINTGIAFLGAAGRGVL